MMRDLGILNHVSGIQTDLCGALPSSVLDDIHLLMQPLLLVVFLAAIPHYVNQNASVFSWVPLISFLLSISIVWKPRMGIWVGLTTQCHLDRVLFVESAGSSFGFFFWFLI